MNKSIKNVTFAISGIVFIVCSIYFFYNANQIWSRYQWALWRLQYPIPLEVYPILSIELSQAIREYAISFPLYFLVGLTTVTCGLIMITLNLRRRIFLITTMLMVSSAFLLYEAYKIWEIYQWAVLQTTTPPLSYFGAARAEATYAFETLFSMYLLIGSIAIASGLILTTLNIKKRFKARVQESKLKLNSNK